MYSQDDELFNPFANIVTELPADFSDKDNRGQAPRGDKPRGKYCDRGVYDFVIVRQDAPVRDTTDPTWAKHSFVVKNAVGQEARFDIYTYSAKFTYTMGTFESPSHFQRLEQFLEAMGATLKPAAPGSKVKYDLVDLAAQLPALFSNDALVGKKFVGTYGYPKKSYYPKFVGGDDKFVLASADTDEPHLINGDKITGPDRKALLPICKLHKLRYKMYCEMINFSAKVEA